MPTTYIRASIGGTEFVVRSVPLTEHRGGAGVMYADGVRAELLIAARITALGIRGGVAFSYVRRTLGQCYEAIAMRVGVSVDTIKRWESDAQPIPDEAWSTVTSMVRARLGLPDGARLAPSELPERIEIDFASSVRTRVDDVPLR